jgi:hypothetical protein
MVSQAVYSVIGTEVNGDCVLFMGNGTLLCNKNVKIETEQVGNVTLELKNDVWYYTASVDCKITIQGKVYQLKAAEYKKITLG